MNFKKLSLFLAVGLMPFLTLAQTDLKDLAKSLSDKKAFQSLSSAPADSVFELQFNKYQKLENIDLEGVHLITNLKLVIDSGMPDSVAISRGLFYVSGGKLYKAKESYGEEKPWDKVGYAFLMKNKAQPNFLDTLVVYSAKSGILAYRYSDYRARFSNLLAADKARSQADIDQTYADLKTAIKGYEKNLFPQDSLYAIGVKYKMLEDDGTINRYIEESDNLYTTAFFFSSNSDLAKLSKIIKDSNSIKAWRPDSLWLIKGFSVKELCGLQEITTFYGSMDSSVPFDKDAALADVQQNKSRVKVYTNLDLLKNELPDVVVDRSSFSAKFLVMDSSVSLYVEEHIFGERYAEGDTSKRTSFGGYLPSAIPLFSKSDDYHINLMGLNLDSRVDEPRYFEYIKLDFEFKNQQRNVKYYDPLKRHDALRDFVSLGIGSSPFVRISTFGYNLNKGEVKKKMVYTPWMKYQQAMERLMEEAEAEAEKEKLINQYAPKYGKTFVQQAFDGNIIVGMHEDLLPIPLKFWKLYKRTDFTGGYTLYLNSLLNSAKRLQVRVTNKKVSYISTW
jgi:hypothetical protein